MAGKIEEKRLSQLIGDIYDAATDPERLPAVGAAVRQIMGVESGIMFICEESSGRMLHLVSASENFDCGARKDYAAYYHVRNPWFTRAVARGAPYVALGEELIDTRDFERTEFRNDWCSRVGIFHMIGGMYRIRRGLVVGSGIHRPRGRRFSEREKTLYALVISHLTRALQVTDRLGVISRENALSLEVLHGLGIGVMLVDNQCRLQFLNAVADKLVRRLRWFSVSGGIVRTMHAGSTAALFAAVGEAATDSPGAAASLGGILHIRDPIEGALPVLVAPLISRNGIFGSGATAIVLFSDPDRQHDDASAEIIAKVFGLTAAEGRVAAALTKGKTLVQYAREAGVSVNTAKTQLSSIFEKTGYKRQSALTAAILRSHLLRYGGTSAPGK